MHKRLRRILGAVLVIANLLSTNMALLVNASAIDTKPAETVAAVETEAEKKEEKKETEKDSDIKESSEEQSATEAVVPTPTSASESEDKETKETEETTAESSEDTESTETLATSPTAEPTATTAPTSSPKPTETIETAATTVPETSAETSTETAATSESTAESSEATEPSESSETSVTESSASETADPTPTAAPSETLTKKVLDSTGKSYTVTASYGSETGIPFDAELEVKEITSGKDYNDYYDKTLEVLGDQKVEYVRIFDISIVKNGVEFEPAEGTTVNVKIQLDDKLTEDVSVVHIDDDKTAEVVETSSVKNADGTQIVFEADGFSAYAIVQGPSSTQIQTGWRRINTLDELAAHADEVYFGNPDDGYYLMDSMYKVNNSSSRTGILKTKEIDGQNKDYPSEHAAAYNLFLQGMLINTISTRR